MDDVAYFEKWYPLPLHLPREIVSILYAFVFDPMTYPPLNSSQWERRWIKRRSIKKPRKKLTVIERYINKITNGGGSRSFKKWLTSKPIEAFTVKRNKRVVF